MTKESGYRLDAAAELIMELLDSYRLPGQTWAKVFDDEATDDPEAVDGEDTGRRIAREALTLLHGRDRERQEVQSGHCEITISKLNMAYSLVVHAKKRGAFNLGPTSLDAECFNPPSKSFERFIHGKSSAVR